jgi:hypothetical protein
MHSRRTIKRRAENPRGTHVNSRRPDLTQTLQSYSRRVHPLAQSLPIGCDIDRLQESFGLDSHSLSRLIAAATVLDHRRVESRLPFPTWATPLSDSLYSRASISCAAPCPTSSPKMALAFERDRCRLQRELEDPISTSSGQFSSKNGHIEVELRLLGAVGEGSNGSRIPAASDTGRSLAHLWNLLQPAEQEDQYTTRLCSTPMRFQDYSKSVGSRDYMRHRVYHSGCDMPDEYIQNISRTPIILGADEPGLRFCLQSAHEHPLDAAPAHRPVSGERPRIRNRSRRDVFLPPIPDTIDGLECVYSLGVHVTQSLESEEIYTLEVEAVIPICGLPSRVSTEVAECMLRLAWGLRRWVEDTRSIHDTGTTGN